MPLSFSHQIMGARASQELGTSAYFRTLLAFTGHTDLESTELDHSRIDLLGGPRSLAHYPMGWAMASNTPFRLYKTNTHQGGQQVPLIVHWGKGLPSDKELRHQYQHVTDILPTICELVGIDIPASKEENNYLQLPVIVSLARLQTLRQNLPIRNNITK